MIYVILLVSFWSIVAVVACVNHPIAVVRRNLRKGNVDRVEWMNAIGCKLICEVCFKTGGSVVMDVRFDEPLYADLKPYLTRVPIK